MTARVPARHARRRSASLSRPVTTLTLRGVRAHGVRFALAVAAVALGIAFVTGAFAFRDVLADNIDRTVATTYDADVYVRAPSGSAAAQRVPQTIAHDAASLTAVRSAVPDASGPAALIAADGTVVDPGMGLSLALAPESDPHVRLATGKWPRPGEIVLETSAATAANLKVGDKTTVVLGGKPHKVQVTGEFETPSLAIGSILIGLDERTARKEFATDGKVSRIAIYADPGTDINGLVKRVDQTLDPKTAQAVPGSQLRADASAEIERSLGFVRTFLLMVAAAALIAGGFVIANAFAMSVRERSREFAVLRSVGTASWQILGSVLLSALGIGVVGSAAGVVLGSGVVALLQDALTAWGMGFSGSVSPSRRIVVLGMTLGAAMSLVAAAMPALRAARVPPVEALRVDALPARRGRRAVLAAVVLLAGVSLLITASRIGSASNERVTGIGPLDRTDPQSLLLWGAALVMAGAMLLAPSLTRPIVTVLAVPVTLLAGALGRLARGNLLRDTRRTANTAGGLLIGMALVSFTGVVAQSTQESLRSITDVEVKADVLVGSATTVVPPEAVKAIERTRGVGHVDSLYRATTTITTGHEKQVETITGVPVGSFGRAFDPVVVAGNPTAALDAGKVVVLRGAARASGWSLGDLLTIGPAGSQTKLTIGAIVDSHLLGSGVVVSQRLFDKTVPKPERIIRSAYVLADHVSIPALKKRLVGAMKPYLVLSVKDRAETASAYAESVNEIVAILYAVLALSAVIALLGIINTLALSVIERTREIGLLRAVGVGTGQLSIVIALEAVLTAVLGTLLGIALGTGIGAAVPGALADRGMSAFSVPWSNMAMIIAAAVIMGLVAAVAPAFRAGRIPVLKAVTTD